MTAHQYMWLHSSVGRALYVFVTSSLRYSILYYENHTIKTTLLGRNYLDFILWTYDKHYITATPKLVDNANAC